MRNKIISLSVIMIALISNAYAMETLTNESPSEIHGAFVSNANTKKSNGELDAIGKETIDVSALLNTEVVSGNTRTNTTINGVVNLDVLNQSGVVNTYALTTSLCVLTVPSSCTVTQTQINVNSSAQYKNTFSPTLKKKFTSPGTYPTSLSFTIKKVNTNQAYTYNTAGVLSISK